MIWRWFPVCSATVETDCDQTRYAFSSLLEKLHLLRQHRLWISPTEDDLADLQTTLLFLPAIIASACTLINYVNNNTIV